MRIAVLLAALLPSTAWAADAAAAPQGGLGFFMMPLLLFVMMYFILIAPQKKRMRQHEEMIKAVKKGDTVLTGGGIIGRITNATDEQTITVEIASGVEVKVARSSLSGVLDKDGKPIPAPAAKGKNDNIKAATKNVANDN